MERAVPQESTKRAVRGCASHEPTPPSGFRREECSEGIRLHFPQPDERPRDSLARCLGIVSLGAAVATGVLATFGHPLGDRVTGAAGVLAGVSGFLGLGTALDNERLRYLAGQTISWLTIGQEEVTAEDRAGLRHSWPRAAVLDVRVNSDVTGDVESSRVYYEVYLLLADGASLRLWSRMTRSDAPFFRATEYNEPCIRAATIWLSTTILQILELSPVTGSETAVGE
ncbi:MAG: hypothetical protein DWH99_07380 [Planctomycetota bacterium]|nr:MAG: hypothetical protein DWH99_07380 [Planctomycetota bacterium]